MTLAEGKKKVYELLDEYSSGGEVSRDADLEAKMADFFDIAQKRLSRVSRIVKTAAVERAAGRTEYAPPADFQELRRVWRGGEPADGCRWRAGKLVIPADDTAAWELEYFAQPATVDADTADDYSFEIAEDAAQAMPFFVAAQQLASDLVVDGGTLLTLYQMMTEGLGSGVPGAQTRPRNVLFRG